VERRPVASCSPREESSTPLTALVPTSKPMNNSMSIPLGGERLLVDSGRRRPAMQVFQQSVAQQEGHCVIE
jgi:hypothetical protein